MENKAEEMKKSEINKIRKLAIAQLSKETGIADYFVQIDLQDEFVDRCILIASQQKPESVTSVVNNCDKPYGYLVNGRFVLFNDFVGKTFDSTDSFVALYSQPSDLQKEVERLKDALKEAKKDMEWMWENLPKPHTSDHFNIPANAINSIEEILNPKTC